nr:protein SRC2 homolog [Lolium perenne]
MPSYSSSSSSSQRASPHALTSSSLPQSAPILPSVSMSSIQGMVLDLSVTGCKKLRDTEFFSRQDPYVIVEYANTKLRTSTCTDGGRNPSFDEKFHIPLIEGLRELNVLVWNSNTINKDVFIGSCKVPLNKVLACGYDDASWPLQTRRMKSAGEVKLIMQFDVAAMQNKMGGHCAPSVPPPSPYAASSAYSYPSPSAYPATPPHPAYLTPGHAPYPAPYAYSAPPPQQQYPHHGYPPTSHPPQPYVKPCPPQPYGQPNPPHPYGQPYPPQLYGQQYPPPSPTQSLYPPSPYHGAYPPPPY